MLFEFRVTTYYQTAAVASGATNINSLEYLQMEVGRSTHTRVGQMRLLHFQILLLNDIVYLVVTRQFKRG